MCLTFTVAYLALTLNIIQIDFPICTTSYNQDNPTAIYANGQYYVFWIEYDLGKVCGARVTESGTVLDPDGKLLFRRQAGYRPAVAYDGTNFLVVFRDSC